MSDGFLHLFILSIWHSDLYLSWCSIIVNGDNSQGENINQNKRFGEATMEK